jgi:hypothetical protein
VRDFNFAVPLVCRCFAPRQTLEITRRNCVAGLLWSSAVHLKWQEVAVALTIVAALLVGKHLPFVSTLPLARVTGILCFGYAIFLSLRMLKTDDAIRLGEWTELRPSLMEKVGALALSGFALVLIYAMLFLDSAHTASEQMAFYVTLAVLFGAGAIGVALKSFFVRVRWNHQHIEHQTSFGKRTTIPWTEVSGVKTEWHGITIHTVDGGKVRFSAYQAGAAQLTRRAEQTAVRNAKAAANREAS